MCAIEVNISCPNVKAGGISFGAELNGVSTEAVKRVTPNLYLPYLVIVPTITK